MLHFPPRQAVGAPQTGEHHSGAKMFKERQLREEEERSEADFNGTPDDELSPWDPKHIANELEALKGSGAHMRPSRSVHSNTKARIKNKTRLGLPLILGNGHTYRPTTILACADTGSEENIISKELAESLGHYSFNAIPGTQRFMLANGNIVESIGCIMTRCQFENDAYDPTKAMTCIFHVLSKLAAPLIVGMAFLEETKTLIEHRDRLVHIPRPAVQALNVYSVGRPRKQLHCRLNERSVLATPDTGSEVDLMSPRFALERGLSIISGSKEMIEFADGSVGVTSGTVQATLQVIVEGINTSFVQSIISVDFLLLDTLVHDVLIGEDSLEELCVFTDHQNSLYPVTDMTGPLGLNSIRYLGAIDRTLKWVKEKLGMKGQDNPITDLIEPGSQKDQKENNRREREATRIACLPENERRSAIAAEAERQAQYDLTPYYCPISSCHREKSGKGFQERIDLKDHVASFHNAHYCLFCVGQTRMFVTKKDLYMHTLSKHKERIR